MPNTIPNSIKNELIARAVEARENAYAPYSQFRVGAALLLEGGEIISGANMEIASYPVSICAERSAVSCAISAGKRRFVAIAVASSSSPPAAPCGMCRQTLAEFAPNLPIFMANDRGEVEETTLGAIFPKQFDLAALKSGVGR